jgi:hypothetical protein
MRVQRRDQIVERSGGVSDGVEGRQSLTHIVLSRLGQSEIEYSK